MEKARLRSLPRSRQAPLGACRPEFSNRRHYQSSFKPNWIERLPPLPSTGLGATWSGVPQPQPKVEGTEGSFQPGAAGPPGLANSG